ncbi:MAG: Jag N-terminal domain-containing protein [Anaerolineae bacterium]|nr:Jag N-terminal domain-containing protein [Anaerolineae bacterium]
MTEEGKVFSAESVEGAIDEGLAALGLARDQVEIVVVDEGGRGILGFGGRPAQVRLTPLPLSPAEIPVSPDPAIAEPEAAVDDRVEEVVEPPPSPEVLDRVQLARSVLADLLARMGFEVQIRTHQTEAVAGEKEGTLVLDIYGAGADSLIGRKGETLVSLQRIVRMIVNRRMAARVNLIVDVEGYKQQKELDLRRLAERMAEQAVKSGRQVVLEPMPAYERRIVHIALRARADVRTESEGAGHRRRVVIIPEVRKEG